MKSTTLIRRFKVFLFENIKRIDQSEAEKIKDEFSVPGKIITREEWSILAPKFGSVNLQIDKQGIIDVIADMSVPIKNWPPKAWLLSAGSGIALVEIFLAQQFPNWTVICVDFADKMNEESLRIGQKLGLKNIHFITADVLKLPLPARCIDYILCVGLMEHIRPSRYEELMNEFERVMKAKKNNQHRIILGTQSWIKETIQEKAWFLGDASESR